ncbi:hypothetical protein NX02_p1565 (plasmid) [Sphingomonas sanxanigenens DSM 19645 = NX02]|uniref:Uncharacterized protein n=1 Tax=Sphingomonas sanxanigenens DSM 19645 = NX02 TaxID=1123269 RepID=A0A0F7JUF4_9SPHN|nr:hypothetical protein NX02_p1565 [Sphingomonas sanxanigenens DSM 19645 = NX02]
MPWYDQDSTQWFILLPDLTCFVKSGQDRSRSLIPQMVRMGSRRPRRRSRGKTPSRVRTTRAPANRPIEQDFLPKREGIQRFRPSRRAAPNRSGWPHKVRRVPPPRQAAAPIRSANHPQSVRLVRTTY